ncbi:MAG: hypothetical protein JSR96_14780 [Proteobacteria bacterium]|nr:hypothetical protein [Pseudomonadota bacterium]
MTSEGQGIGTFLGRMMQTSAEESTSAAFGSLLDLSQPATDELPEPFGAKEPWLRDLIDADEDLDYMEKALLAFIAEETGAETSPT